MKTLVIWTCFVAGVFAVILAPLWFDAVQPTTMTQMSYRGPTVGDATLCINGTPTRCIDNPTPKRRYALYACASQEQRHRLTESFDACVDLMSTTDSPDLQSTQP